MLAPTSDSQCLPCMHSAHLVACLPACHPPQKRGASNVLVTLGSRGSLLLTKDNRALLQPIIDLPGGTVVDATGG